MASWLLGDLPSWHDSCISKMRAKSADNHDAIVGMWRIPLLVVWVLGGAQARSMPR